MKKKKTYIHVNQHVIRANKKNDANDSRDNNQAGWPEHILP